MSVRAEDTVVVKNIYYMLAYAYRALESRDLAHIEAEDFDNVDDLLAAILAAGLEVQRRRGFERGYIEVEEDVPGVKGRIMMQPTFQHKMQKKALAHCAYDEFSEDTTLNRILKSTALALLRSDEVRQPTKADLKRVLLMMRDVGEADLRHLDWSRIQYHRNNRTYQLLISICYLVLHQMLPTEDVGDVKFASFIDSQELHALYERFVLRYFERHHPELNASAKIIDRKISSTAPAFMPQLCTDITLTTYDKTLIIDTKCYGQILKTHHNSEILSPANLNQILSYVIHEQYGNKKRVEGMLLYALTDRDKEIDSEWEEAGMKLYCKTLDLSREFPEIAAQLDSIAEILK